MNCTKFYFCIRFYISFKIRKANFIEILKFPILLSFFLYSIICEMDQFIIQILQSILFARCTHIPLLIPISFNETINASDEDVTTNIEFALIVQERILHVFLYDKCTAISTFLGKKRADLRDRAYNLNTVAAIRVFSWFAYPDVTAGLLIFVFGG